MLKKLYQVFVVTKYRMVQELLHKSVQAGCIPPKVVTLNVFEPRTQLLLSSTLGFLKIQQKYLNSCIGAPQK